MLKIIKAKKVLRANDQGFSKLEHVLRAIIRALMIIF